MDKKFTPKQVIELLAPFIKAARHTRNFGFNEQITVGMIRSESVEAEVSAERILGKDMYDKACKKAFTHY